MWCMETGSKKGRGELGEGGGCRAFQCGHVQDVLERRVCGWLRFRDIERGREEVRGWERSKEGDI